LKRILVFLSAILLTVAAHAQSDASETEAQHPAATTARLLLVLPFENRSTAPGLEWIGESFPEVLNQRMAEPWLFIIDREDRVFALDRMGVPTMTNPSRATIYTVAQAMDVDYVILGSYNYDGRTFAASAQVLDMRNVHLSSVVTEAGPLLQIIDIQTALAWDVLQEIAPDAAQLPPKDEFVANKPPVRLDALESFVRGVIATTQPEKIKRFKEAVRISPDYDFANLQLARTYYNGQDYEQAATWFGKVPRSSPQALEASFYYGICEYYMGDYDRAADAFQFVATRLPLTEVENDLGVVAAKRGKVDAGEFFRRAVQSDPRDGDYRFNYASALLQSGDLAEALRQAKEALSLQPNDANVRALVDASGRATAPATNEAAAPAAGTATHAAAYRFAPRLKTNYDETTFRQAELELHNLEEATLASKGPQKHAEAHIERGNQFLTNRLYPEAEREFREAVVLEPTIAAAHLGLARAAEAQKHETQAIAEANAALRLEPSAAAHVLLARAALGKSDIATATRELDAALALDPKNNEALSLRRDITVTDPDASH